MQATQPSPQREDLKYGDPHLNHGAHPFYGPDKIAILEANRKDPTLESHGFYMAKETKRTSLWQRFRSFFTQERTT